MPKRRTDKSWWPTPLAHIPGMNFLVDDMVTVAELSDGAQSGSTRDVFLAMLDLDDAQHLLDGNPKFSYFPGCGLILEENEIEMEPLAIRWEAGANNYVQVPSQHFLRSFRLVPRPVDSVVFWDDLAKPQRDIVRAEMVSKYDYPNTERAAIQIRRDYLLEYADKTNRAIVALWYEWNSGPNLDANGKPYTKKDFGDFLLPGRMVGLKRDMTDRDTVIAEFWGFRPVYLPKVTQDISSTHDELPSLLWPGIKEPVSRDTYNAFELQGKLVYVQDSVLDVYEEHPETYTVHPDTGGVSYAGQWSVSYCHRCERNLIALEVKKLYEGAPGDVIRHWYKHAVPPPSKARRNVANVATRSHRIVSGLLSLGEALSELSTLSGMVSIAAKEFVGLDGDALRRTWWYHHNDIRPITRRIPIDMGKHAFLDRCEFLAKLLIEGLNERNLRRLLIGLGMLTEETNGLRTLKLLDRVLQSALVARESGLHVVENRDLIQERYREKQATLNDGEFLPSPAAFLFTLYDVRTKLAAHRGGKDEELLSFLGISGAHVASGWGKQMDVVYDLAGETLEASAQVILDAVRETKDL